MNEKNCTVQTNKSSGEGFISNFNEFTYNFIDDHKTMSSSENVTYIKDESQKYFRNNEDTKKKFSQLLTRALDIQLHDDQNVKENDIKLHLCYPRLAYNLGPSDRQLLCTLIGCVISHVRSSCEAVSEDIIEESNTIKGL